MEKFKILLIGNSDNVRSNEIKLLSNSIHTIFNNNDYDVQIMYNILNPSYKSAGIVMENEPDVAIFIDSSGLDFQSIIAKDKLNIINKPFIHNLQDYLNRYTKYDKPCIIKQINIPVARTYPFLSAYISTNDIMADMGYLSKAIYKAIIKTVNIDKKTKDIMYKTTANLNLKKSLDKDSIVVTKIPKGSFVKVVEKTNNIYWKVEYESPKHEKYIGYAAQTYIIL